MTATLPLAAGPTRHSVRPPTAPADALRYRGDQIGDAVGFCEKFSLERLGQSPVALPSVAARAGGREMPDAVHPTLGAWDDVIDGGRGIPAVAATPAVEAGYRLPHLLVAVRQALRLDR